MVDITMIIIVAVVGFVILGIGGGIGYIFWLGSRPKRMAWKAKVYQLGDGVVPPIKDKGGQIISNFRLSELKPYTTDTAIKIDKKDGSTNYWLSKLKKAIPAVTADCVEVWGQTEKWVHVLLEGDTCTLLKMSYSRRLGEKIFRPMPHDRINMIKTEIAERKARIENTKDILAQITPFIVAGIMALAMVAIAYFIANALVTINERQVSVAEKFYTDIDQKLDRVLLLYGVIKVNETSEKIIKEEPPEIPP